ncbi:hypothetical protein PAXRUDRAFT_169272, partial [Paxillus rubicundulus Ve08.2h10]
SLSKCPISPPSQQSPDESAYKKPHTSCNQTTNPSNTSTSVNDIPLLVCAVWLGHECHLVIQCKLPRIWDNMYDTISKHINKAFFTKDRHSICSKWQQEEGCSDRHDNRPFCSGCRATSHGTQHCP